MAKSKLSQSWSIDVVIGSIVFIGAFFVFYSLLNSGTNPSISDLTEEASIVIREIASDSAPLRVVEKNEINVTRLNELKNLSYDEIKKRLRIQNDFCIYLENEMGELILMNNSYKGIGSPNINISGTPCSQN